MMSHVAEARRAAALALWAASGGAPLSEAVELMRLIVELWPDAPPTLGAGVFADTPSAAAWERARQVLESAQEAHGIALNLDWERRAQAERLVADFMAKGGAE